jgi:hypothetical protein
MSPYLLQNLLALDQLGNTLLGGMADETISARCFRRGYVRRMAIINWIFSDPNHCRNAYRSEFLRSQLPIEYRRPVPT